jgi:DHA1 family multidrug resistance protein-like MFS transporter
MVGIQFIMTMAFSVLSPIMPLLLPELGVETPSAADPWAGILNGVTSFVAAFASPIWGRVADRRGRKLMLLRSSLAIGVFSALMGVAATVRQFFSYRALIGVFAGFSSAAIALVLGFIRTIHRNIALLLFPAKELSEHLADGLLFPLFYQVEIRHRQLLQ